MREHLKGAGTLPFVGFVTHDGKWIDGYSGYKDADAFLKVVEAAEASPALRASEATRKKLAALVEKTTKAVEASDWKTVVAAAREAGKTTGRCPERKALAGHMKQARAWASGQLDEAVKAARAGELAKAQEAIDTVKKHFAGEPEGADADLGAKAVRKLSQLPPGDVAARGKAAKEFIDTRWDAAFEAKPAEDAPAPEKPADG
jgi:soluble cytochrome b562